MLNKKFLAVVVLVALALAALRLKRSPGELPEELEPGTATATTTLRSARNPSIEGRNPRPPREGRPARLHCRFLPHQAGVTRTSAQPPGEFAVPRKSAPVLALAVVALVALIVLPAAFAGKGGKRATSGGTTGSSLVLDATVGDTNGDGVVNWGETVTFKVYTSASKPYVNVRCYQGTAFVYDAWAGFYAGAWFGRTFTLSSTYWTGGAASCTARLVTWSKNGRQQTHATLNFPVQA